MVAVRGPGDEWREGRVLLPERRSGAMKTADVNGSRAGFCCQSGGVGAMKTDEVNGARAGFCCRSGAVGAMKTAEVNGARAGFCCRSGAGLASCRSYAGFGCRARTV